MVDLLNLNRPAYDYEQGLTFFGTCVCNVMRAEEAEGVEHHVGLSLIAAERLDSAYDSSLMGSLSERKPVRLRPMKVRPVLPRIHGPHREAAQAVPRGRVRTEVSDATARETPIPITVMPIKVSWMPYAALAAPASRLPSGIAPVEDR